MEHNTGTVQRQIPNERVSDAVLIKRLFFGQVRMWFLSMEDGAILKKSHNFLTKDRAVLGVTFWLLCASYEVMTANERRRVAL